LVRLVGGVAAIVGIALVLIGTATLGRCQGLGLEYIGVGFALGGFGGTVAIDFPPLSVAGAGGVVVLIFGAFLQSVKPC
jgi:hypothetical protein